MRNAHVILEISGDQPSEAGMRWERRAPDAEAAFELLGRAFEIALRESDASFGVSLRAFLRGAIIRRQDVADVMKEMD